MNSKTKDDKGRSRLTASMIEDDATERLKKRARDLGLIVNAGSGRTPKNPKRKADKNGGDERHHPVVGKRS
jgi:hypothetical protein